MVLRFGSKKLVLAALVLVATPRAATSQSPHAIGDINGWYPCSIDTLASETPSNASTPLNGSTPAATSAQDQAGMMPQAECAQFTAPLFHDGTTSSNDKWHQQTIPLFVKRLLASENPHKAPNVWFLQGGPGSGSVALESVMTTMQVLTKGQVNLYTMDHRGTGRSALLDCPAAQATTPGSLGGPLTHLAEVPSCSQDLEFQYGPDLSSFSITSAAKDVAWLIGKLQAKQQVFVYGVSYGTAVVERLMHLNVPEIAGYIMDGVATSSGAGPADKFQYFSAWDSDMGEIGQLFLDHCSKDAFCASKFGQKGPTQTLWDLYARVDQTNTTSSSLECAALAAFARRLPSEPLSYALRMIFGNLLQQEADRLLIPALVYRLDRCNPQDREVLHFFFNSLQQQPPPTDAYYSDLLHRLIAFSEMWETPPPRMDVMVNRFTSQLMAFGQYHMLPSNCFFRLDYDSPACKELGLPQLPPEVRPIAYQPDEYWNVSATIPSGASVLIMHGRLDPQTIYRYAQYLYESLKGSVSQKKLLRFENATHGLVNYGATNETVPCGLEILTRYVLAGGDLSQLDTSCMDFLPQLNFSVDATLAESKLGTWDAYDGPLAPQFAEIIKANGTQVASGGLA